MNADEMNWLLQTIEDPETAKRFVQAQYKRGRISYDLMASLALPSGNSAVHRDEPEPRAKLRSQYARENRKTSPAVP